MSKSPNETVAVIGAGPAGLSAACLLAEAGYDIHVFEASDQVGGMAKSISMFGQRVDLGPHRFFSKNPRVNRFWLKFAGSDVVSVRRLTRIFYKGRFFQYPLRPLNALSQLGLFEAVRCVISYCKAKAAGGGTQEETFEGWVVSRFGRRLFEIFFKSYSEKLWGISCRDLDADFAAQRIQKLSLAQAILAAIFGNRKRHKTLIDEFYYPYSGSGAVYESMARAVQASGGHLHFNTRIEKILTRDNAVTGILTADGNTLACSHVISTMPLTKLIRGLGATVPQHVLNLADQLSFRNTILVYLEIEGRDHFPDNWVYIHSAGLKCGRVTNFRNWSPGLYGSADTTVLCLEYWCNNDDDVWSSEDRILIAAAEADIRSSGLIGHGATVNAAVHRVPKCYPVYRSGYREVVTGIARYLDQFDGLIPIGRYGSFKYNNQDHSILMGILASEKIKYGMRHDLWQVNSDLEYQEDHPADQLSGQLCEPRPIADCA